MLDWKDVKSFCVENLATDGDSSVPLTGSVASATMASVGTSGIPAIGSITDTRLQFLLQIFTSYTKYLWTPTPVQVYLATGDTEVDLSDISTPKCDLPMCWVSAFWLNSTPLRKADNRPSMQVGTVPNALNTPSSWLRSNRHGSIIFDNPCVAGLTGTYVAGAYRHPTILFETQALALAEASVAITGATVTSPIVVHAVAHGRTTGQKSVVAGVAGMTEANGTWIVTVIDADHLSLNGSIGVNPYTSGGTISRPADAGACLLSVEDVFTFAAFASVNLKETVVTAEASLARMQKKDKESAIAMRKLQARALRLELEGR